MANNEQIHIWVVIAQVFLLQQKLLADHFEEIFSLLLHDLFAVTYESRLAPFHKLASAIHVRLGMIAHIQQLVSESQFIVCSSSGAHDVRASDIFRHRTAVVSKRLTNHSYFRFSECNFLRH
jgi:hypothetical protein